uniref:Uncharacterized protein n=2 Tax=Avena sativa TaxID=4498 RepID=A0ACD5XH23_AVESA
MEPKDLMQRLPEDALAAVLHRLPPHGLAAARCVCKAWHTAIDARRLLDLFPPSLAGLFINFFDLDISEFFFRPLRGTDTAVSGKLHYVPTDKSSIVDHCNGLLLLHKASYVVNPATQCWAPLPRPPPRLEHGCPWSDAALRDHCYIVFDPAVSQHYEVVRIPSLPWRTTGFELQLEWPPSSFVMHVFSSATGNWEERSFARRGDSIGTVAHLQELEKRSAVLHLSAYWRGELYVLTQFVMRISLSKNTYQAIKPPVDVGTLDRELHLGRSENGVYFASFNPQCRLRVWILNELHGETYWVLKHDNNLDHMLSHGRYDPQFQGPWIIEDINYDASHSPSPIDMKEVEDEFGWNSDNENTLDTRHGARNHYNGSISILGFHPYREVIFLNASFMRGLAYNINSSKLEDLGSIYPKDYSSMHMFIEQSFPYTPCWIGKLPGSI